MLAAPVLLCLCVSLMNRSYFSPWFLQVELQWKRRRENIREPDRECLTHNETRDGEGRWGVSRPEFPYKFNWGFSIILSVSTADVCVWPENKHVFLSSCACINMQGWPANVTGEENVQRGLVCLFMSFQLRNKKGALRRALCKTGGHKSPILATYRNFRLVFLQFRHNNNNSNNK